MKNNSLERLAKAYNKIDETILKQYTKLTSPLEKTIGKKGKYLLSTILGLSSIYSIFQSSILLPESTTNLFVSGALSIETIKRSSTECVKKDEDITDSTITANSAAYVSKKISKIMRTPLLGVGLFNLCVGAIEFSDYVTNGNSESLNNGTGHLYAGYSFASLASSMYINDSNPKLLEKEPQKVDALERFYQRIKKSLTILKPIPVPVLNLGENRK